MELINVRFEIVVQYFNDLDNRIKLIEKISDFKKIEEISFEILADSINYRFTTQDYEVEIKQEKNTEGLTSIEVKMILKRATKSIVGFGVPMMTIMGIYKRDINYLYALFMMIGINFFILPSILELKSEKLEKKAKIYIEENLHKFN